MYFDDVFLGLWLFSTMTIAFLHRVILDLCYQIRTKCMKKMLKRGSVEGWRSIILGSSCEDFKGWNGFN